MRKYINNHKSGRSTAEMANMYLYTYQIFRGNIKCGRDLRPTIFSFVVSEKKTLNKYSCVNIPYLQIEILILYSNHKFTSFFFI